jgi:hypothetical protein
MPVDLTDLLHDAAVLHRFADFIDEYCKAQERSQTYADASGKFFKYVEDLCAGIKEELFSQVKFAGRFPHRIPVLRNNIRILKDYLRSLHELIKPAADAHTLTTPASLVELATDQLREVRSMRGSEVVVLLTPELMYFQIPHTEIKKQGRLVERFIIPGAQFPPRMGFIELPYSQGTSFFANLAIYHEIGHFLYEDLSNPTLQHKGFSDLNTTIIRSLRRALGLPSKDRQAFTLVQKYIEDWTQEIFCDLFAIRLVGPAFSLSFIEMLGMLDLLSDASSIRFYPTHPAPAFRLAEHLEMLRRDSWWDAISKVDAHQKNVLERLAKLQRSKYRFYFDENEPGPQIFVSVFLDNVVPKIRDLVHEVTIPLRRSVKRFKKDQEAVEKCLMAGVVPHSRDGALLHPTSIINAAFLFYLTSLPDLIKKFDGSGAQSNVEVYSEWARRLELWTMKAIDDSRLYERFRRQRGRNHGAPKK